MARRKAIGFEATLFQGHKGVTAVIVPFDPRATWDREPVPLDARREGWLVAGTVNGARFEGWIGFRWGRFFLIVDAALRAAAEVAVGDALEIAIAPTDSASALAIAREQAVLTTAPRKRAPATRASAPPSARPARTKLPARAAKNADTGPASSTTRKPPGVPAAPNARTRRTPAARGAQPARATPTGKPRDRVA
jgi:hypothetical protein